PMSMAQRSRLNADYPTQRSTYPMRRHTRPSIFGRMRALMLALALILVPLLSLTPSHTYAATPGAVVGWGNNDYGQVTIPAGLSDVTAIAAGWVHSLAL